MNKSTINLIDITRKLQHAHEIASINRKMHLYYRVTQTNTFFSNFNCAAPIAILIVNILLTLQVTGGGVCHPPSTKTLISQGSRGLGAPKFFDNSSKPIY